MISSIFPAALRFVFPVLNARTSKVSPKWSVCLCSTLRSTSLHLNGRLLRGADAWMALQIKWRREAQLMAAFQHENVASDFCKHEPFRPPFNVKAQNEIVLQIWMNCIQMQISASLWAETALLLLQIYRCLVSQTCHSVQYGLIKSETFVSNTENIWNGEMRSVKFQHKQQHDERVFFFVVVVVNMKICICLIWTLFQIFKRSTVCFKSMIPSRSWKTSKRLIFPTCLHKHASSNHLYFHCRWPTWQTGWFASYIL